MRSMAERLSWWITRWRTRSPSGRCVAIRGHCYIFLTVSLSQLKDILETVDTELSSTSLTPEQLAQSKVFLFVTPQRKVIACAVVQRIKVAYQIVSAKAKDEAGDDKRNLLRFGEDQGAIFCSYVLLCQ